MDNFFNNFFEGLAIQQQGKSILGLQNQDRNQDQGHVHLTNVKDINTVDSNFNNDAKTEIVKKIEEVMMKPNAEEKLYTSQESNREEEVNKDNRGAEEVRLDPKYIPHHQTLRLFTYLIIALVLMFVLKIAYSYWVNHETEKMRGTANHCINEVEEELKRMKDRNKLY